MISILTHIKRGGVIENITKPAPKVMLIEGTVSTLPISLGRQSGY